MKRFASKGLSGLFGLAILLTLSGLASGQSKTLPSTWGKIAPAPSGVAIKNPSITVTVAVSKLDSTGKEIPLTTIGPVRTATITASSGETLILRNANNPSLEYQRFLAPNDASVMGAKLTISVAVDNGFNRWTQLPVPVYGQQTGMWCWAASGEMTMNYLGLNVPQCVQMANRYNKTPASCCLAPVPSDAIRGGYPEFDKYGVNFQTTASGSPLSFEDLKTEIKAGRPVPYEWLWTGGGGHIMVAVGIYEPLIGGSDGSSIILPKKVLFNDPGVIPAGGTYPTDKYQAGGQTLISYDAWCSDGGHRHGIDYFKLQLSK